MVQNDRKLASMLSLAQRAGCIASGEEGVEAAIKKKISVLVIRAEDAADNTKKKFLNKADFYKVNVVVYGRKQDLGKYIGKNSRSVISVTENKNFADRIMELIDPVSP